MAPGVGLPLLVKVISNHTFPYFNNMSNMYHVQLSIVDCCYLQ